MSHDPEEGTEFKVQDRRHWMSDEDEPDPAPEAEGPRGAVGELRLRAETAEAKLLEYIAAYKEREQDQEAFRVRIAADVERRVEQNFGDLAAELLETLDELDLALSHGENVAAADSLIQGVTMVRDRFLAALERKGIRRVSPSGESFDPHTAEAVRVDPVDSPAGDGTVTETLRPGYMLGERVIRPARVAVGKHVKSD